MFSGPVPAQPVGAKQPKQAIIHGFYRLLARYSRPNQPIDLFYRLDLSIFARTTPIPSH
jgi:hypothetical protein